MRGRHFAFIGLFFAAWVSARIGFLGLGSQGGGTIRLVSAPLAGAVAASVASQGGQEVALFPVATKPRRAFEMARKIVEATGRNDAKPVAGVPVFSAAPSITPTIHAPALRPIPFAPQPVAEAPASRRLEIYAYSFVRRGSQTLVPLASGRYGGSQSAIVAAYPLLHFKTDAAVARLSLVGRVAISHDNRGERELAAGLRWQPVRQIPVHLTAERRFLHGRTDAFALYAAGGKSGIMLPLDFQLEGYAQAGFVAGQRAGAFADFSARADRQVISNGAAALAGGVGLWGGGQSGIMRVDIGPTFRADVVAGGAQFRLAADWRFRVAGSAKPGNGPALTLSTSF